jgi:hypothetical protein
MKVKVVDWDEKNWRGEGRGRKAVLQIRIEKGIRAVMFEPIREIGEVKRSEATELFAKSLRIL